MFLLISYIGHKVGNKCTVRFGLVSLCSCLRERVFPSVVWRWFEIGRFGINGLAGQDSVPSIHDFHHLLGMWYLVSSFQEAVSFLGERIVHHMASKNAVTS